MLSPTHKKTHPGPTQGTEMIERLPTPFLLLPSSPSIKSYFYSLFLLQLAWIDIYQKLKRTNCMENPVFNAGRRKKDLQVSGSLVSSSSNHFLYPPQSSILVSCFSNTHNFSEVCLPSSHLFSATTSSLGAQCPLPLPKASPIPQVSCHVSSAINLTWEFSQVLTKPHLPP